MAAPVTAQSTAEASQSRESFQSIAQSADAARDAGNAGEAIRDYTRALALRPDWAEGWWDLGTTQYETNEYNDAVTSLHKLVNLAPNSAAGWSILGLSEFEAQAYSDALSSLEKAQKLGGVNDPEIAHVSAYHLALLLIRSGQFEKAVDLLHSQLGETASPQVRTAYGFALLRIPLLPSEIDPSHDALIQEVGDAWTSASPNALPNLFQKYSTTPWLHYSYGLHLAATGHVLEAIAQQKIEATLSPQSPLPWIEISSLALRLKDAPLALNTAKQAVSLDNESSAAHNALAKALTAAGKMQQAAIETRAYAHLSKTPPQRDPHMIALYAARSSAAAPEDEATWSAAMQAYSEGHYPETIAALKNWVEQNPADGTAWAVIGLSEFALKDYDNARIHLQRGIGLGLKGNAESVQLANARLAQLMIRNGQFDAATSLLTPLADHPPIAEQIQLALGLALLRIPVLPENLDAPQRELAQSAGAIVEMLLASRYADAFPAFRKLIAEHPSTPWLHYGYGDALDSLSQYDDSKAQMKAEIRISPHSPLPWIRLASISVRQHLPADALKAAQTAVEIAPGSAEAHYELGRTWLESADPLRAISELQKANSIKSDNPEIHFALARAYAKANLPEKAAAERAVFMQLEALASQKTHGASQGESILNTNAQRP